MLLFFFAHKKISIRVLGYIQLVCLCCCRGDMMTDLHQGKRCSCVIPTPQPLSGLPSQALWADPGVREEKEEAAAEAQTPRRTRRHRTIFTEEQLDALEELFLQNHYPDVNAREKLAQSTRLREERVEVSRSYGGERVAFLKLNIRAKCPAIT